jgi:hypothetical protein
MMPRFAALLLLLVAAGCQDGIAPPPISTDLATAHDQGVADATFSVGTDLRHHDGGLISCTSACDCPPGEQCMSGACAPSSPLIYCCGTSTCPGNEICETPAGRVSQCGAPADAGAALDAGMAACSVIGCIKGLGGDGFCKLVCGSLNGSCVQAGNSEHCMP